MTDQGSTLPSSSTKSTSGFTWAPPPSNPPPTSTTQTTSTQSTGGLNFVNPFSTPSNTSGASSGPKVPLFSWTNKDISTSMDDSIRESESEEGSDDDNDDDVKEEQVNKYSLPGQKRKAPIKVPQRVVSSTATQSTESKGNVGKEGINQAGDAGEGEDDPKKSLFVIGQGKKGGTSKNSDNPTNDTEGPPKKKVRKSFDMNSFLTNKLADNPPKTGTESTTQKKNTHKKTALSKPVQVSGPPIAVEGLQIVRWLPSSPPPSSSSSSLPYTSDESLLSSALSLRPIVLPVDDLPRDFLIDVVSKQRGAFLIALIPKTKATNDDSTTSTSSSLTSSSTSSSSSSFTSDAWEVIGASLGLYMTYWSRKSDARYKLMNICNIFSIFVHPQAQGKSVGSKLLDNMVGMYKRIS